MTASHMRCCFRCSLSNTSRTSPYKWSQATPITTVAQSRSLRRWTSPWTSRCCSWCRRTRPSSTCTLTIRCQRRHFSSWSRWISLMQHLLWMIPIQLRAESLWNHNLRISTGRQNTKRRTVTSRCWGRIIIARVNKGREWGSKNSRIKTKASCLPT
jgi:hypothetical protein